MNRKGRLSFCPGAASLILIVVILSMSVLGMLALMNGRSDARLSERSIDVVTAGYALNDEAQRALADLDGTAAKCAEAATSDDEYAEMVRGMLPAGMLMNGREISWEETDGLRTLECVVELLPWNGQQRFHWVIYRLTAITGEVWN